MWRYLREWVTGDHRRTLQTVLAGREPELSIEAIRHRPPIEYQPSNQEIDDTMDSRQRRPRPNSQHRHQHHQKTTRATDPRRMAMLNDSQLRFGSLELSGTATATTRSVDEELGDTGWICEQHTSTQPTIIYSTRYTPSEAILLRFSSIVQHGFGLATDPERPLMSQCPTTVCRPAWSSRTRQQLIPCPQERI